MSNLSVDLTGLTSGTVKFTMPTKDVKDAALSGSLKYTVRLNGEVAATGTAAAGAAVNTNFTTTVSGMTNVTVTAEIAASGNTPAAVSAPVSQSVRLGYDQPKKPTGLKAAANGQNVTLTWKAHSGEQMLVSFSCASTDGGATKAQNDDWLISPQLNGEAQTISFFAKAGMGGAAVPEQFEVLYSKTSKAIANFQKLGETEDVNNVQDWEEYEYKLPEGTKYFAIRCVSNNKFALLLDDIKFVEAGSKPEDLQLNGYNVYRDGKKVNKSLVSGEKFTDNTLTESAKYGYVVTAVYDKGESLASNLAEVEVTVGINDIDAAGVNVSIEKNTLVVTGAMGKTVTVYAADGALVAQRTAGFAERISVVRGMYIVKAAGVTYKVLVK